MGTRTTGCPGRHDPLTGRRVTVVGLARQGRAAVRFLLSIGAQVTVTDQKPADRLAEAVAELTGKPVRMVLGGHPLAELLDGCDLLCLSGGVSLDSPLVLEAQRRGIPLTNDALLTLERSPAPVIGITGSSGKTTTTTLTGEMLRVAGVPVWVGGNIGTPLIDRLDAVQPNGWVVMELSSFQTELFDRSPHVGAVLNITPNHLDRHPTMAAYTAAKERLLRFQEADDVAVLGLDNPITGALLDAPWLRSHRLAFSLEREVAEGAFLRAGVLWLRWQGQEQAICRRADIRLQGEHNVANLLAASCLAAVAGAPVEALAQVARTFTGVEHRLEWVRTRRGVEWYNDSIATTPERAIAAMRSFEQPLVLLAGGRDKHLPWASFVALAQERVRHLVLFGEAASLIASAFGERATRPTVHRCTTLAEAVERAAEVAQAGDVVLLSPGGTSFDAYTDFAERGNHFKALARALPE